MSEDARRVAAEIAVRNDEFKEKIARLLERQDDLQDDILDLLRRKRDGENVDDNRLEELKKARREAGRMAGLLAAERTELLDDLPVIRTATGKLQVAAAELAESAELLERATARVKEATKSIQKAEKFLVKIVSLLA